MEENDIKKSILEEYTSSPLLYSEISTDDELDENTKIRLKQEICEGEDIFAKFKSRYNIGEMEQVLNKSYNFMSPERAKALKEREKKHKEIEEKIKKEKEDKEIAEKQKKEKEIKKDILLKLN